MGQRWDRDGAGMAQRWTRDGGRDGQEMPNGDEMGAGWARDAPWGLGRWRQDAPWGLGRWRQATGPPAKYGRSQVYGNALEGPNTCFAPWLDFRATRLSLPTTRATILSWTVVATPSLQAATTRFGSRFDFPSGARCFGGLAGMPSSARSSLFSLFRLLFSSSTLLFWRLSALASLVANSAKLLARPPERADI